MLVEDLIAVLDATVPAGARVHLVGHDWGSIAGWDVLAAETWDPRLEGRLASYTSASGPPLDHLAQRGRGAWRGRLGLLPQALHSWYVWLFLSPVLPELSWRRKPAAAPGDARASTRRSTCFRGDRRCSSNSRYSIDIYRANVLAPAAAPLAWRTSVPIQLVVAHPDAWVTPASWPGSRPGAVDLTRVEIDVGHWMPAGPSGGVRRTGRGVRARADTPRQRRTPA